jgi:hypothetical protein
VALSLPSLSFTAAPPLTFVVEEEDDDDAGISFSLSLAPVLAASLRRPRPNVVVEDGLSPVAFVFLPLCYCSKDIQTNVNIMMKG